MMNYVEQIFRDEIVISPLLRTSASLPERGNNLS